MKQHKHDAAILLGGALASDGSLDSSQKEQVQMAADLFAAQKIAHILMCGAHGYKDAWRPAITEAQAYARHAMTCGVPRSVISLEERSLETVGNLYFAKKVAIERCWQSVVIIPTNNHASERIAYLVDKIFGTDHRWVIQRAGENRDPKNIERELLSLTLTKDINGFVPAGDHETIYRLLCETHPSYGGSKFTVEELRALLDHS